MILRTLILAGTAAAALGSTSAWAQSQTLTENINNTGIPRNAPSLGLSNIYGLNPCATGTSVGVSTPLFGIGGAVSDIDKECETRNNAAVVISALKDESLAREILCQIRDVRQAAVRIGKPCLQDEATSKVGSATPENPLKPGTPVASSPAATAPVGAEKPAISATMMRPVAIRLDAPLFCRLEGLDVQLYPECLKAPAPVVAAASPVASPGSLTAPAPVTATSKKSAAPDAGRPLVKAEWHPILAPNAVLQTSWRSSLQVVPPPAVTSVNTSAHPTDCSQSTTSSSACESTANQLLTLEKTLLERRLEIMGRRQAETTTPAETTPLVAAGGPVVASLNR